MDKNEEKVLLICPLFADVGSEDLSAVSARQGARRMDVKKGQIVLQRGRTGPLCGRYPVRGAGTGPHGLFRKTDRGKSCFRKEKCVYPPGRIHLACSLTTWASRAMNNLLVGHSESVPK